MKIFFLPLLFALPLIADAQQDSIKKHVILIDVQAKSGTVNNYYLQSLSDTSLSLTRQPILYGTTNAKTDRDFYYDDIKSITYRRKGATGRTILAGTAIGFVTGAIIGLASGDDDPNSWFRISAGEKALAGGFLLGITGAIVGTIAGLVSNKRFVILGERNRFRQFQQFVYRKSHKTLQVNY